MLRKTSGKSQARTSTRVPGFRQALDSYAWLGSIVDSSDDAIIGKDLDGTIVSWNRGAQRLYGYTFDEIIGKNITTLSPPDRVGEIALILEKIARGERVEHFHSLRITKDKRLLEVSVTISPVRDKSGRIIGASAIARDIGTIERARRALRDSESRTDAIVQAAAQAIIIVDSSGNIVMVNPATRKMFGYADEELIGRSVDVLVPDAVRGGHKNHRQTFFKDPKIRPMGLGMELQGRKKDGSEFYAEISLSYIQGNQGIMGVAFVTDISQRRADEQAIRHQREELRHLAQRLMTAQDDERKRIARDLHDDLSQRLAYLAIDLGRVTMKPAAQELQTDLRQLQLRASEAAEAVRKISHQLHPSVLDDIGLDAALEQYCSEFEERSGIHTEYVSQDVPDDLRPDVAASLYHIAKECLRNVSKHSRTETVSVTLQLVDDVLRLAVKDRGVGLTDERTAGKGIGFAAMKERAHLVNGKMMVQSQRGIGTEVLVEIPVSDFA